MQSCLRDICYLAAVHGFEDRSRHIVCVENRAADYLSRWHSNYKNTVNFLKVVIMVRLRCWRSFSCFQTTGKLSECKKSVAHTYAVGTYNNIKPQWESYFLFCFYYNFIALPSSERILSLYAQFLNRSFKSIQSIQNYISGVKLLHLFKGIDYPQFDSFHLRLVWKG